MLAAQPHTIQPYMTVDNVTSFLLVDVDVDVDFLLRLIYFFELHLIP